MEKEQLKRIFDFLEEKGEHNKPLKLKLIFNEPLTEEDLNVKGNLNLRNANITSLPEGLQVDGSLSLNNCYNLTSLPKNLDVTGNLDLFKCVKLTSLPKGLKVGGILELRNTKINSLPKGLEVHFGLFINNTALLEYTNNELREMIKPGFIKGEIIR
jgi:hypothetical protein